MSSSEWYRVRNLAGRGPDPQGPEYYNEPDGALGPKYATFEEAKRRAIAENKATGDNGAVIVEDDQGREVFRPGAQDEDEALT